jgi:flotillin
MRSAELQKEVDTRNIAQQTEKLRSEIFARTTVESEAQERRALADLFQKQKAADAALYEKQQAAEAHFISKKKEAEAYLFTQQQQAQGDLVAKQREADGVLALFNAQAEGLTKLLQIHPDPQVALQYMMIDREVYIKLAETNANAIRGLEPKITWWVTGGGKDGDSSAAAGGPLAQIFQNMAPVIDTVARQTGTAPPSWMVNTEALMANIANNKH